MLNSFEEWFSVCVLEQLRHKLFLVVGEDLLTSISLPDLESSCTCTLVFNRCRSNTYWVNRDFRCRGRQAPYGRYGYLVYIKFGVCGRHCRFASLNRFFDFYPRQQTNYVITIKGRYRFEEKGPTKRASRSTRLIGFVFTRRRGPWNAISWSQVDTLATQKSAKSNASRMTAYVRMWW